MHFEKNTHTGYNLGNRFLKSRTRNRKAAKTQVKEGGSLEHESGSRDGENWSDFRVVEITDTYQFM